MKLNHYIYSLIAGLVLILSACSPDEYDMGNKTYVSEDLVEGLAYTVTIEGNRVHLKSNITGCTPLWVTPQGRSQENELSIELPFAGSYEVTFGAETPGGVVFGEPHAFKLVQNDFSLLGDEKWFLLSDKNFKSGDALPDAETLAQGISKKWYPCDANYGIGQCSGPMVFVAPYDPDGDGAGFTDKEKEESVYKGDFIFGTGNWKPNWDPGFQSFIVLENDPYMGSYMTFSMDAASGCVATMYRGEAGDKTASTGTNMVGKFNMNLSEKTKPTITFTDCYAMHPLSFDATCSNYTQDIQIAELTPYILQLVTRRTNSEGNWYLVWNFVSEEVIQTQGECIPKEESGQIEKAAPVLPKFDNLLTDLFTTEINGVTYVGSQMTFNVDTEAPYDWLWWNGSPNAQKWESVTGGTYNNSWAPAAGDEVADFELILSKASDGTYNYEAGETGGKVMIADGVMTFDKDITILTASSDQRTVTVTGKVFTILGVEAAEKLVIGVPESVDENGVVNSYLVANLLYKKISTGPAGPTVIGIDNSLFGQEGITWLENGCIRLAFHHYGADGKGLFKDAASVKLKKNQTISVTFKINGGITWIKTPKCALIDNNIKTTWEPACFDLDDAVTVNTSGETTVTLTNTTGATVTFVPTCLDLSIQYADYGVADVLNGDGNPDWSTVGLEIVSCTIQ